MDVTVHPGRLSGRVTVPGSKSHTIRALVIAALAAGESVIEGPLESADTHSCADVLRGLGVQITEERSDAGELSSLKVSGTGGRFSRPPGPLDCGNSGTTFYIMLSVAALAEFPVTLTGDSQLRRRSAGPLLAALESLGVTVSREGNGDCPPVTVRGPFAGGSASVSCTTSQYLTSLLLAAPLASGQTVIDVPLLNERPYVEMTLAWLESQGVAVERTGWSRFVVPGRHRFRASVAQIPGDFSAATFFAVAAAAGGGDLEIGPLDRDDTQGDKAVFEHLERLGCSVAATTGAIRITGPKGRPGGGTVDLNHTPDAVPAFAVLGTMAREPLEIANVAHARDKETDRLAVMANELGRLGVRVEERPDGLLVHPGPLRGGTVSSHGDHRVAMALSIAGTIAQAPVTVTGAECVSVTFPRFFDELRACGVVVDNTL
jgi:3-phosphoshikimate 1-carboxyvinyltransferase